MKGVSEWVGLQLDIPYCLELLDLLEKDFYLSHHTQPNNFGNGKWRFYKFLFHLSGNINCSHSTLRKLVWAQATNGSTFLKRTYHIHLQFCALLRVGWYFRLIVNTDISRCICCTCLFGLFFLYWHFVNIHLESTTTKPVDLMPVLAMIYW